MEEDYISFLVYDSEGDIIRTGECLESLLLDQAETTEGETAVENPQPGVITDLSHYWDGTAFVEYPPSPGDWAVFDHVNEVWTDPRPVNHDDDFNANDYSFDGEYGYDDVNDRIYWDAGVAIRDNARYSEQQSYSSGYIQWTSGVIYVYYDWDLATFVSAPAISAAYATPRRILVGEYRGGDQFIDALSQPAVDGTTVYSNTVETRHLQSGSVSRSKIENGSITEQADYSVYPFPGFDLDVVTSDIGAYNSFPDEVLYGIGEGSDMEYRLILTPRLFEDSGAISDMLVINNPTVAGTFSAKLSVGFSLYRYNDGNMLDTPVLVRQGSGVVLRHDWINQRLIKSFGAPSETPYGNDFILQPGIHYSEGNVFALSMYYQSWSSSPTNCSITMSASSYGFTWKAFWK